MNSFYPQNEGILLPGEPKQVYGEIVSATNCIFHPALIMKNNSTILTLSCFGVIIISLFLPFYEGTRTGETIPEDSFVITEIYDSAEFGIRLWVFNGFGSLFALINLPVTILLVFSHFFFPRSFPTAIGSASVFLVSLILLVYGTSDTEETVFPDEMLIGFYLLLISQVILITQSFTNAITAAPKKRMHDSDLLDF